MPSRIIKHSKVLKQQNLFIELDIVKSEYI